ncbi:MAG TPA: transposase [Candidatus Dojkabacteria bacterium]|nr:transposase [Candidatus Dojkabacteria bacterium]
MGTNKRDFKAYSFYHIYNRGNNKDEVLKYAEDKAFFISTLYKNIKKTDLHLDTFCIMDNHFHLLIRTKDNPNVIPKFMQRLGTAYAIYINKRYKRVGHAFQGPYEASYLRYKKDIMSVRAYIKNNPVEKGLVKKGKDYPWCKL